ncbi:LamG-like jellyroll fold domain-containing protein [Agrobacterium sp. SORGH_AS 787]|uniref:LamG-like jellyroll fold domain-containing protein n=1 Tax=Agrobacterium sp. SORGH_AS 787 TaxID=3041775 RepID=UPI0027858B97|nr:hypothetical protein [Rhizobium sp. SORGH_AS_0787]
MVNETGTRTPNVQKSATLDHYLGSKGSSTRLQTAEQMAQQLLSSGPMRAALPISGSNTLYFTTKAAMQAANLSSSAVATNLLSAWVYADETVENNGIYKPLAGTPMTWQRILDLPMQWAEAEQVAGSTANAIKAKTGIPVSRSLIVALPITAANTTAPTVSFNEGAALSIVSNSGNAIAAGGLVPPMMVWGFADYDAGKFRLINDQVASAIVAAAEAAANSAKGYRDDAQTLKNQAAASASQAQTYAQQAQSASAGAVETALNGAPVVTSAASADKFAVMVDGSLKVITKASLTEIFGTPALAAQATADSAMSVASALALEVADLTGRTIGYTGGVADAFDDTTGVVINTGGLDENTLVLISANGANNSTAFVDGSAYGRRVTPSGDAKILTAQSKFGGSALYLDGSGDILTVPFSTDFNFGTGDFTIDFWTRIDTQVQPYASFFHMNYSSSGFLACSLGNSDGKLNFVLNNVNGNAVKELVALAVNTWTHYAIVRKNGVLTLYKNGVFQQSVASTLSVAANGNPFQLGWSATTDSYLKGYIDEFRVSNIARWDGEFSPPASAYTQNAGESQNASYDPVNDLFRATLTDPNTRSLLHFDGTPGSRRIVDETGRQWTASGDARLGSEQSKFGGTSAYFDGSGDSIDAVKFDDLEFGYGDFTIEFWFRTVDASVTQYIFEMRTGSDQTCPVIYIEGGKIKFYSYQTNLLVSNTTISSNTWYHVAVVRRNLQLSLYLNGALEGSASDSGYNYKALRARIGAGWGASNFFSGYIDEFRISQSARYSAAFSVPTAPFSYSRNNLTLLSQAYSAAAAPASGRLVVQTLEAETITINTDLIAEVSRDNGTTWTAATLALISDKYGIKMYEGQASLSAQPAGTSMRWRTRTLNNKNIAISGVVENWRQ